MSELTRTDKVTLAVTEAHIEAGEPGNKDYCALAIALDEFFPYGCEQQRETTHLGEASFDMSDQATEWVTEFDESEDEEYIVQPCIIEVDFGEKRIEMVEYKSPVETPEWSVSFSIYQSAYTTVRARTEDEAIEKAKASNYLDYGDAELDMDSGYATEL